MNVASCLLRKPVSAGLILFLAIPLAQAAAERPSANTQPQDALVVEASAQSQAQPQAAGSAAQAAPASVSPQAPQQSQEPAPSGTGTPVGTAAAPVEKTTGVTASRPAGAVIAPAKQKRARAILIRVGIVVGAAVAVGIVIGASKASNGRPN
jgi:hypothetical protein